MAGLLAVALASGAAAGDAGPAARLGPATAAWTIGGGAFAAGIGAARTGGEAAKVTPVAAAPAAGTGWTGGGTAAAEPPRSS